MIEAEGVKAGYYQRKCSSPPFAAYHSGCIQVDRPCDRHVFLFLFHDVGLINLHAEIIGPSALTPAAAIASNWPSPDNAAMSTSALTAANVR
ncbi:hypothetical protein FAZ95_33430 [Trinickia violacea]|uniref:Uncharacterized protein n=1 Tax=Trinickia violacea TaxID=2571746 RepID=A0A4P8IX04_9BURK|nr:hypothetical protein [Trinickia violacea]QCP53898.1 hypothetical protein FAZ95_33430 [Trinickia violacea]